MRRGWPVEFEMEIEVYDPLLMDVAFVYVEVTGTYVPEKHHPWGYWGADPPDAAYVEHLQVVDLATGSPLDVEELPESFMDKIIRCAARRA